MFASKDLFNDDGDEDTNQPTYIEQSKYSKNQSNTNNQWNNSIRPQYNTYGRNENNTANYGMNKNANDDDEFDDVLNNIPTNNKSNQYYQQPSNQSYSKPQYEQRPTTSSQYSKSKTGNVYNASADKGSNFMNLLYDDAPNQQQEISHSNNSRTIDKIYENFSNNQNNTNNNNNNDDDEVFELGGGGDDDDNSNQPSQNTQNNSYNTNNYSNVYQPQQQQQQSVINYIENVTKGYANFTDDPTYESNYNSRPQTGTTSSTSFARPGTASMDARQRILQLQKERLINEQKKRFSNTGTLQSNEMLNKGKQTTNTINYQNNNNNDSNNPSNAFQFQNNSKFHDPTMVLKRETTNLPELSKVNGRITFQRLEDDSAPSPKSNQHTQNPNQQNKMDYPDNPPFEEKEESKDNEDGEEEENIDEKKIAELEKKVQMEKEAMKDKKDLKVELASPQPQSLNQIRILQPNELNGIDMRSFLTRPCPKGILVQCTIKRDKSGFNRFYPKYICNLSNGSRFLMVGKKRSNNKTSNYLITYNKDSVNKKEPFYLGKLRSNFLGTEFNLFDHGENPKKVKNNPEKLREQLSVILFESNILGAKGPRKMKVLIPDVKPTGEPKEGIFFNYKSNRKEGLKELINKPPKWNEQVQAFVLNFNGRVEKPSVKNFQLIDETDENSIILQFGRISNELFNMDFQWPLSPLQAFGICLSSFDYKIACEQSKLK